MPIVKALWKKKEAYYCFSEENHLIAGWRNGFNLKYIGCDAFGNVYGSNEVEGVTTWWYYIGTRYRLDHSLYLTNSMILSTKFLPVL